MLDEATLVQTAHAAHPKHWIDAPTLAREAHAREASLDHAADLYLALACAAGNAEAIAVFEREHIAHVASFVARINSSPAFAEEVCQRLRSRLLVGTTANPPRIATYSARGPLGGWLRISAVREARELEQEQRGAAGAAYAARELDDAVGVVDPEVAFLKEQYGAVVSDAFGRAIARLDSQERALLRMHYVDAMTLEQVASVFRLSRATGARMLAKARMRVVEAVRDELRTAIGAGTDSANSLLAFVRSRIEIDLIKHLESQRER